MGYIKKSKKVLKGGIIKIYEYDSDKHQDWQKTRPKIRFICACGKNVDYWRRKRHERSNYHCKRVKQFYNKN